MCPWELCDTACHLDGDDVGLQSLTGKGKAQMGSFLYPLSLAKTPLPWATGQRRTPRSEPHGQSCPCPVAVPRVVPALAAAAFVPPAAALESL